MFVLRLLLFIRLCLRIRCIIFRLLVFSYLLHSDYHGCSLSSFIRLVFFVCFIFIVIRIRIIRFPMILRFLRRRCFVRLRRRMFRFIVCCYYGFLFVFVLCVSSVCSYFVRLIWFRNWFRCRGILLIVCIRGVFLFPRLACLIVCFLLIVFRLLMLHSCYYYSSAFSYSYYSYYSYFSVSSYSSSYSYYVFL